MFIFVIIFQGRMTQEPSPPNHRRRIAEEPPRGFVDFFGINSEKVMTFFGVNSKKVVYLQLASFRRYVAQAAYCQLFVVNII